MKPVLEGPAYDIITTMIKFIAKKSVFVPSGFVTNKNNQCLKCSVKASEGYLFPLNKSMIFVHKPTTFIWHDDITHVELLWVSEYVGSTGWSFDLKVVTTK